MNAELHNKPFDIEVLFERCLGNTDTVELILDHFETNALREVENIKSALKRADCGELGRNAHKLSGAAGMLSALDLSELAFNVEQMGSTGVLDEATPLIEALEKEIQACISHLPSARQSLGEMKIKPVSEGETCEY